MAFVLLMPKPKKYKCKVSCKNQTKSAKNMKIFNHQTNNLGNEWLKDPILNPKNMKIFTHQTNNLGNEWLKDPILNHANHKKQYQ